MGEQMQVLVVEDEVLVAEMIGGLVRELGHEVAGTARDGDEAVALAERLSPSAVIMDINMPGTDGLTAARRITERCPAPIVILSAFETSEMLDRATDAGVGAYLVKPPNVREVDRALTIAAARFQDLMTLRRKNAELREALSVVRQLSGLLPICAGCKRIRDDRGSWQEVEEYIQSHSSARFSHGMCPDCLQKFYPEYGT